MIVKLEFFLNIIIIYGILLIKVKSADETKSNDQDASEYIRQVNPEYAAKIQIKVYTGKSNNTANVTDIPITDPAKIYQNVDKTKPLVYYAHGYTSGPSDESVQTIIEAHLKRGSDNIFIVDWSKLASGEYNVVLGRIKSISKIIARSFDEVVKLGLNIEKFHFVGHSMGAQIAGFVGKYSINSIPRITGLDPALPGFYLTGFGHIDKDSARFVDIIHTDGGHYGVMSDTGTVDFYANGGHRPQPGCESLGQLIPPNDFCSHRKAWKYYAQTVNNNTIFTATKCSSHDLYKSGSCNLNKKVPCGYATPTNTTGSYYFQTVQQIVKQKL